MITKQIKTARYEAAAIWSEHESFAAHAHDEFVLSCNIKGHEKLRLDGRAMEATQHATTLYNPGQIQSGSGTELIGSIYLDQAYVQQALHADREIVFDRAIVDDPQLLEYFAKIIDAVLSDDALGDLEEVINGILLISASRYSDRSLAASPHSEDWRVQYVLNWLRADLSTPPSLEALANEVDLSKTAFLRMFSKAVGTTPSKWHRSMRLAEAKTRLRQGQHAARVASDLGYCDQAHLIKQFRHAYGITPGFYVRK
ncbi:AraC family transcriptional regulator [Cohaesibacter sp. CAU 1516]|uniref:helix-turn-helix domain-containing protein n=1 Tax=Cohaesibacter sp. CAU 1516 TaxID=2576038 RepID=UPI0010FDA853|nr:AraC family transcriptional regulator [Cohaesibacter sp. CAU 1516]TLP43883.1 AraC family transcriptional regulator [Cohaesibacter sp. CAU 1516]